MQVGDVIIWKNDPDYLGILVKITEEHMAIKPLSPRFIEELRLGGWLKNGEWLCLRKPTISQQWRKLCKNSK